MEKSFLICFQSTKICLASLKYAKIIMLKSFSKREKEYHNIAHFVCRREINYDRQENRWNIFTHEGISSSQFRNKGVIQKF